MSFASRIVAFSDRFLSQRSFELIVAPALADLEFEDEAGRRSRLANHYAVLRAVAGGVRDDVWRDSGSLFKLALLSVCYYMFPIVVGLSYFKTWFDFFVVTALVLALSLVPVVVCFWPQRHPARPD
jgi:hypothetical protein